MGRSLQTQSNAEKLRTTFRRSADAVSRPWRRTIPGQPHNFGHNYLLRIRARVHPRCLVRQQLHIGPRASDIAGYVFSGNQKDTSNDLACPWNHATIGVVELSPRTIPATPKTLSRHHYSAKHAALWPALVRSAGRLHDAALCLRIDAHAPLVAAQSNRVSPRLPHPVSFVSGAADPLGPKRSSHFAGK